MKWGLDKVTKISALGQFCPRRKKICYVREEAKAPIKELADSGDTLTQSDRDATLVATAPLR